MLTLQGREVRQHHGTSADATEFAVGEIMPFVADGEPYIAANGTDVNGGYRMYGFSLRERNFRSFYSKYGLRWTAEPGVRLALNALVRRWQPVQGSLRAQAVGRKLPDVDNRTGKPYTDFQERSFGTLLVELLQDRKLRLEIFPGKPGEEVTGFSSAARLYER